MDFYGFLIVFSIFVASVLSLTFVAAVIYNLWKTELNQKLKNELKNKVELWEERDAKNFVKRFLKSSD